MGHIIMAFYILFFSTGFMGGTVILLLKARIRSRLLFPFLIFQILFLIGMGLIIIISSVQISPVEQKDFISRITLILVTGVNTAVWGTVIVIIRRYSPPRSRLGGFPAVAVILAVLVALKSIGNMIMVLLAQSGTSGLDALTGTRAWNMGGHIVTGLAMAAFGIILRGPQNSDEPTSLKPLFKAYGLCSIIFAPAGIVESVIQANGWGLLSMLSLDHLFYFSWNIISMTAAVRLFSPSAKGSSQLEKVPEERIKSLKLTAREVEMAVMIGQGLSNKEIAEKLFISPATVRTHIYNLYQKAEARSRVELLNKLRK